MLAIGTLAKGGVFTIQIEGGKRNNSGFQLDITGMEGDLRIYNHLSFANHEDNTIQGSQRNNESLEVLPIPDRYCGLPASKLDASVLDLAYLYDAFADEGTDKGYQAPDFCDAARLHKFIDLVSEASATGTKQTVDFWPAV